MNFDGSFQLGSGLNKRLLRELANLIRIIQLAAKIH